MPPRRKPRAQAKPAAAKPSATSSKDNMTFIKDNVDIEASRKIPFFPESGNVKQVQMAWKPPISRWKMVGQMTSHPWFTALAANRGRSLISDSNIIQHVGFHDISTMPGYDQKPIAWHAPFLDFSVHPHPTQKRSKAWEGEYKSTKDGMLPGQTLAYQITTQGLNDGDVTVITGYANKGALCHHTDTAGK